MKNRVVIEDTMIGYSAHSPSGRALRDGSMGHESNRLCAVARVAMGTASASSLSGDRGVPDLGLIVRQQQPLKRLPHGRRRIALRRTRGKA